MLQYSDISPSLKPSGEGEENPFHGFRLQFNTAFLTEDFVLAEQACLQALKLEKLSASEVEEVVRYLRILGKGQLALDTINRFCLQAPNDLTLLSLKLDLLLLLGYADEYEQSALQALDSFPHNEHFYRQLYDFLQGHSRTDELHDLLQKAAQHGIILCQEEEFAEVEEDSVAESRISDANLQSCMQLLAGRENAYARQWVNDNGQSGYALVNEPLTPQTLKNHFQGNYTIGAYQLDTQNMVGWIVFDLDLAKEHQNDLLNPEFKSWVSALLLEKTQEIVQLLSVYHIPSSIEFSGYKGYHIWVFLEQRLSASLAKAFAERIAAQIPMDGLPLNLELFPKQSKIKQGFGNLVKLPYGIHRRSGMVSTFLDENLSPLPLSDFIVSVKKTDALTFVAALDSLGYIHSEIPECTGISTRSSDLPLSIHPDPEEDIEWLCLKQYCYALSFLDSTIKTKRKLSGVQKNILRYTAGYLKNGPAIVNKLLSQCQNVDAAEFMKSGFKGNATGCTKIRNSLAAQMDTSQCNCSFDLLSAAYPNPLLHLAKLEQTSFQASDLNELKLKELVDSYLRLLKNHQEVSRQLHNVEAQILNLFEHIGIDHMNTDYGVLCYGKSKDQLTLNLKVSGKAEP